MVTIGNVAIGDIIWQPLPTGIRQAATLLLECRRFSADVLLIAADAFDEASRHLKWDRAFVAAAEAAGFADRLRERAPERARMVAPPATGPYQSTCEVGLS